MSRSDEFQERDIVRLLVQFGSQTLDKEGISIAEFILADISESLSDFDNALYGKMAGLCYDLLLEQKTPDQNFFIHHPEKEISDLAIDLLTSPFDMSHNWEARWGYPLQNQPIPDLNFDADMRQALDRFKLRKLNKLCNVLNPARIKAASESENMEEVMRLMRIQEKLKSTRNELAKKTGTIVLP